VLPPFPQCRSLLYGCSYHILRKVRFASRRSPGTKHDDDAFSHAGCLSGKPDADFALMMIPHHQGAIEMAKVELQFGADPNLRRLAQEIIVTQQSEIDVIKLALRNYPLPSVEKKKNNWCSQ
jgi:hypothetical protein